LLAATLVRTCGDLDVAQVRKCAEIVISVLTGCRHKGAIVSAQSALQELSAALLLDGREEFSRIPGEILRNVLDQVEDDSSSVTRRGAGLPLLVLRIVSSEPRGRHRKLLHLAVKRLLDIASKDLPVGEETRDCGQVRGGGGILLMAIQWIESHPNQ